MEEYNPYKVEDVFNQTNEYRTSQGLKPLVMNDQLSKSALAHAQDINTNQYWAHDNPNGKTWNSFIKDSGYPFQYAGENIASGYNDTGSMMQAWKNSPKHNANLISPNYRDVGIAIVPGTKNGRKVYYVIQKIGRAHV